MEFHKKGRGKSKEKIEIARNRGNRILSLFSFTLFSHSSLSLSAFSWSLHLRIRILHSHSLLSATHKYKCTILFFSSSSSHPSLPFSFYLSLSSNVSPKSNTTLRKFQPCCHPNMPPRRRRGSLRRREPIAKPKLKRIPIRIRTRGSDLNPRPTTRSRLPAALCRERSNSSTMNSSNATT